jgi:NarL family two-component system response regulator LiaR
MANRSQGSDPVSVVVCDDQRMLTDALSFVFNARDEVTLSHPPVNRPEDAIEVAEHEHPDVVLMDVTLGSSIDGIEATRRIRSVSPSTSVVVFTADPSERRVVAALEAGAAGVLSKEEPVESLVDAVLRAARGACLIDAQRLPGLMAAAAEQRRRQAEIDGRLDSLTQREWQILQAICRGERSDHIARRLFISPRTVATHTQSILRKLHVHSQLAAVALAAESGRLGG